MTDRRSESQVEVVVTLPEPFATELLPRFGMRTTLGVLTELLASAKRHVAISAPYIQGNGGLHAGPLGMALVAALRRGVKADVISTGTSLAGLDVRSFKNLAGSRFRTLQPRGNVDDPRMLGSHAKFCLSDGEHAYIGSANITQWGMSGHLELGVLLHGKPAQKVFEFLHALLETGYLIESPS